MSEVAVITTTEGEMVIEFWPDVAPGPRREFQETGQQRLLRRHLLSPRHQRLYDSGRRPADQGREQGKQWGTGGPGYQIKAEFNDRSHTRGVLSMARSNNPDSAGSQFFICHGDPRFSRPSIHDVRQADQRRRRAGKNRHHTHASATGPDKRMGIISIKIVPATR